ncbi:MULTISPECIES: OmpA family protein [Agrobacterium]|uniref:OmpA family protein n=1 Tax=Agrobacterium TaxID=357 RepID=UPI001F183A29|nr:MULTISPECIES: OmpA family protein [Agrobacterium]
MADMTISFLFILMILLAFFASQFNVSDTVPRSLYDTLKGEKDRLQRDIDAIAKIVEADGRLVVTATREMKEELERLRKLLNAPEQANKMEVYNSAVANARKELLTSLKSEINSRIPGVNVEVSANYDALQFAGDGLFDSGKEVPTAVGAARMRQIAEVLDQNLGCYSLGLRRAFAEDCNPAFALIDSLQVEGHTDNTGSEVVNMDLSAKRAASIYSLMIQQKSDLVLYQNRETQPVLSVAGFGKGRPIQQNETESGRDANRRIDLRFIMVVPSKETDIAEIRRALSGEP